MIELNELTDAAQKAFPADALSPARDASWELMAEMGWLMIRVPEEMGGLGLGREASTAIHYEMGRVLSCAPLMPAQFGLQTILGSDTLADKEDWVERICGGEYVPLHMVGGIMKPAEGGSLTGTVPGFFEADMASVVVASLPHGYALVPLDAEGVSIAERPIWDPSRRMFDLVLDGYRPDPAFDLATGPAAKALHDALSPDVHLAIAADCLGGAQAALDMTVEYLGMRKQFERPIGMFQALKHRVADLKTKIVATDALLWSRVADDKASNVAFGGLKAQASDVYQFVTEEMIQLHGGIGLTEEHQAHRFMKRAMLNLQLAGSADLWKERVGREALATFA